MDDLGLAFDHWCLSKQSRYGLVEPHSLFLRMVGGFWMQLELEVSSEANFLKFKGIYVILPLFCLYFGFNVRA